MNEEKWIDGEPIPKEVSKIRAWNPYVGEFVAEHDGKGWRMSKWRGNEGCWYPAVYRWLPA